MIGSVNFPTSKYNENAPKAHGKDLHAVVALSGDPGRLKRHGRELVSTHDFG